MQPIGAKKLIAIVCFFIVVVCFVASSTAMLHSLSFMMFFVVLFAIEYFLMINCAVSEWDTGFENDKADR